LLFILIGCTSTKSTLKNIDNTAVKPKIRENSFLITEYANDTKYGYNADYPINIGLILERQEEVYIGYFFNGLEGTNGKKISSYRKVETCCPFPTTHNTMGAGTLGVYEVSFEASDKKVHLYFNIYEKGKIMCPNGFSIKKFPAMDQ
jgi:hypothetical protein